MKRAGSCATSRPPRPPTSRAIPCAAGWPAARYGTRAAELDLRHPGQVAPVHAAPWALAASASCCTPWRPGGPARPRRLACSPRPPWPSWPGASRTRTPRSGQRALHGRGPAHHRRAGRPGRHPALLAAGRGGRTGQPPGPLAAGRPPPPQGVVSYQQADPARCPATCCCRLLDDLAYGAGCAGDSRRRTAGPLPARLTGTGPARELSGHPETRQTRQVASKVRTSVRVQGVVQGVGFRPFVYSLATRLGLAGSGRQRLARASSSRSRAPAGGCRRLPRALSRTRRRWPASSG